MREILFRGKRTDNGEWVQGDLLLDQDLEQAQIVWFDYKSTEDGIERDGDGAIVIPETVGQYTGLTDKNGRKIFEGDILHIAKIADGFGEYYQPPLDYPVNVVVKWDLCAWMWETLCDDKRYITFPDAWCHYECEIIGNTYDNPELLEVEQNG